MSTQKKTCFVVMGFGEKVDLATGRKLNLDASYQNLIKPTVEDVGLECVRADEIVHSGNINVPMYERLLTADLVIADLSTSNNNAFYELGVRHALRPYTTIIIAENEFNFPFDIAQIAVRKYKHLGDDIGVSEARRFCGELKAAIEDILAQPKDDSPVYIFLNRLRRLRLPDDLNFVDEIAEAVAAGSRAAAPNGAGNGPAADSNDEPPPPAMKEAVTDLTHAELMKEVADAKKASDFVTAKALLSSVRRRMKGKNPDKPEDPYIIQQLALVTYKSKLPTPRKALEEARDLLLTLNPETSNDTETLGLWGAVHKRLWDLTGDRAHLDEAVRGYERGFYLRNDYYNGINLAFILNVRAANAKSRAEAVADFVQAKRIRLEVIDICQRWLKSEAPPVTEWLKERLGEKNLSDAKYWVMATLSEAYAGIGDDAEAEKWFSEAAAGAPEAWMLEATQGQIGKLSALIADSPLKYVTP